MSDAWKGVSRARKCPICQHEDWCGYWTPEDYGGELICCQRDKEKCNMIGSDGQEYVFIGSAKGSGSSIYEERTQYELLRKKKTGMNYSHISKPQKRELKPVDQIVPKNNENCSSIYTYMQNLLILDPAHKAYLHSQGWTDELIEKTLNNLKNAHFNKIRFCIWPKHYDFNLGEPRSYPYEGKPMNSQVLNEDNFRRYTGKTEGNNWDFTRFCPEHFRHIENCILKLQKLGIEAELIVMHPYDRWGFSSMTKEQDDLYWKYVVSRFSAYRNIWWSLANEYDLLTEKTQED